MSDKETAPRVDNRPCDDCGNENPVWFADNEVWNAAVPERVGYICPNCFIRRADSKIRTTGWKLVPELAVECTAPAPQLSFEEFQRVNKHRCETKFHQCETWLPSGWPLAIAGEAGELCNLIKKIIRGDFTFESKRGEILKELADVIIYSDLMISAMGASTGEVVAAKFDEVSRRVNYTDHIFAEAAAAPQVTPTEGNAFTKHNYGEKTCVHNVRLNDHCPSCGIGGTSEQAPQEREKP